MIKESSVGGEKSASKVWMSNKYNYYCNWNNCNKLHCRQLIISRSLTNKITV